MQGRVTPLAPNRRPLVGNIKDERPINKPYVYVGLGTPWGNPFSQTRSRQKALAEFKVYILTKLEDVQRLRDAKPTQLYCSCHPLPCHADFLADLVEMDDREFELLRRLVDGR